MPSHMYFFGYLSMCQSCQPLLVFQFLLLSMSVCNKMKTILFAIKWPSLIAKNIYVLMKKIFVGRIGSRYAISFCFFSKSFSQLFSHLPLLPSTSNKKYFIERCPHSRHFNLATDRKFERFCRIILRRRRSQTQESGFGRIGIGSFPAHLNCHGKSPSPARCCFEKF